MMVWGEPSAVEEQASRPITVTRRTLYGRFAIGLGVCGAALIGVGVYEGLFAGSSASALVSGQPPLAGHPAPSFTLSALDGTKLTLASFRGRPVLLNFWATWCVPCRTELPALQRFAQEQQGRWAVLGVDELEDRGAVTNFAQSLDITYPLATDTDGSVGQRYNIGGLPSTFAVDAQGIIRKVHLGPLGSTDLQQILQEMPSNPRG